MWKLSDKHTPQDMTIFIVLCHHHHHHLPEIQANYLWHTAREGVYNFMNIHKLRSHHCRSSYDRTELILLCVFFLESIQKILIEFPLLSCKFSLPLYTLMRTSIYGKNMIILYTHASVTTYKIFHSVPSWNFPFTIFFHSGRGIF